MPIVSIILPSYKKAQYISHAIESILGQSFSDWELIVIDDGLAFDTRQLIAGYAQKDKRIIVISNPKNLGIQKSLNKGLAMAKGKYIARIDDDDQWIDGDKLKKQVAFLDADEDYVLVGTNAVICDENLIDLQTYSMPGSDLEIRNRILFKNCFLHSSVMIRKSVLDKIGGYVESKKVRNVEDYDLWLRIGLYYPVHLIDRPLTIKRGGHDDQLSRNPGLDQYRIQSIVNILDNHQLNSQACRTAVDVLVKKCRIYANGCARRGRTAESDYYRELAERYRLSEK